MTPARAVRELQAALHLRLDAVYAPTVARIRAVILRLAGPAADGIKTGESGNLTVLTPVAARLALIEIDRILAAADERAVPIVARGLATSRTLADLDPPDIERAWREAAAGVALYLFSTRRAVGDRRRRAMSQVQTVLDGAARTGRPAEDVATHLSQYANPRYATRRDPKGTIRRGKLPRVSGPALPGRAGVPSRHLMTSEIIIKHGEATIERAARTPGGLVRWDLAPWHDEADDCNDNANRDVGFGPGLYPAHAVPDRPHIGCVCLLIYVSEHET